MNKHTRAHTQLQTRTQTHPRTHTYILLYIFINKKDYLYVQGNQDVSCTHLRLGTYD